MLFQRGERIAEELAQKTFEEAGPSLGCVREILDMMDPLEARGYLSTRARRLLRDRLDEALADAAWPRRLDREILDAACKRLVSLVVRSGGVEAGRRSLAKAA
jgi:hypothetical protein